MPKRLDLFPECHDGTPIDVFTAECCMRCVNPECTRSVVGQSKFELRVGNWYDRLFANVPRMLPDDPQFAAIAGKKFLAYNQPLTVRGSWTDPRDLEAATDQAPALAAAEPPPAPSEPLPEAKPVGPPAPPPAPKGKIPAHLALSNTPAQKSQMVRQAGAAPPAKPASSWDAPLPSADTEGVKIVQPGAKIRIR